MVPDPNSPEEKCRTQVARCLINRMSNEEDETLKRIVSEYDSYEEEVKETRKKKIKNMHILLKPLYIIGDFLLEAYELKPEPSINVKGYGPATSFDRTVARSILNERQNAQI